MDQISIVIADDHPLYREGVARTLMEDKALIVVGQRKDHLGIPSIVHEERQAAMRAVSALPSLLNEFSCGGTSRMAKLTVPPSLRFSRGCGL